MGDYSQLTHLKKIDITSCALICITVPLINGNCCSRHFTGCQSKTGLFLRLPLLFSISLMVPCHHTCRRVSPHTLLLAFSIPVQMKKLFLVQYGNVRALVTGRSLFRLPLSGTTFLLTSDTAVLSRSSKLLFKPFSLLLPTLS